MILDVVLLPLLCLAGARSCPPQTGIVEGRVSAVDIRVAGSVVFLVPETPTSDPPAAEPALIDQVNLRFVPRVLVVTAGTIVDFRNSDPILHNVFSPKGPGPGFDLGTYPRGEHRRRTFTDLGVHVVLCHVHPEMAAYVAVVPTRHHAIVDERGRFRIENVPAGSYTLHLWPGRRKPIQHAVHIRDGTLVRLELDLGHGGRGEEENPEPEGAA